MKKIYYLLSLGFLAAMTMGCNDWLDVNPRSQIKSETMYETEAGFKLALNGAYIKMGGSELYGKNTTMLMADGLTRTWNITGLATTSLLYGVSTHNYTLTNVEAGIKTVFLNYYSTIAQLNDLLANLETTDVAFEYNNDKIIKAEAMGLRAFLHLDVLRFFGPVPSKADDNSLAIPYVTELTNDTQKLLSKSWKQVAEDIERDLTDAETLLKQYDPLVYNSVDSLKQTLYLGKGPMPKDSWQLYRQGRFNYYAVLGTKARFYHWIGNKEQAVKYAKMVIDSKKFTLCTEAYFSTTSVDLTLYKEHLFGIHNPDLQSIVEPLFATTKASLTPISVASLNTAYESTVHSGDIRYVVNRYWQEKTYDSSVKVIHFYKYTGNGYISASNRLPLLKYVEMYLILTEDLPLDKAKDYFVEYRQSRALSSTIDATSMADEAAVIARLEKEYRKEFMGEGQMFFFYKKHDYAKYTWPAAYTLPANAYVLPKPKEMSDFE